MKVKAGDTEVTTVLVGSGKAVHWLDGSVASNGVTMCGRGTLATVRGIVRPADCKACLKAMSEEALAENATVGVVTMEMRQAAAEAALAETRQKAAETLPATLGDGISLYGARVALMITREGGYTPEEANAMVRTHADIVDKGDRFGSNLDYVAWEVIEATRPHVKTDGSGSKAVFPCCKTSEWYATPMFANAAVKHHECSVITDAEGQKMARDMARAAEGLSTGGVRRNVACAGGCGFPTAQANGYVRGHTPRAGYPGCAPVAPAEPKPLITNHEASSHSRRSGECRVCGEPVAAHAECDVLESLTVAHWTGTVYGATVNPARVARVAERREAIEAAKAAPAKVEERPACDCPTPEAFHYSGCPVMVAAYQGRTSDGHKITHGMAVWDYDLRPGYVSLKRLNSDGWFNVVKDLDQLYGSLMNDVRVCVRHPFTGQLASEALAIDSRLLTIGCRCSEIIDAGPSDTERTCPCGSVFPAMPVKDAATVAAESLFSGDTSDVDSAVEQLINVLPAPRGREITTGAGCPGCPMTSGTDHDSWCPTVTPTTCECESFVCQFNGTHKLYKCTNQATETHWVALCPGCAATVREQVSPEAKAAFEAWSAAEYQRRVAAECAEINDATGAQRLADASARWSRRNGGKGRKRRSGGRKGRKQNARH